MANDLESLIPQLATLAVPVLRNNAVIPRLALREALNDEAADQGDRITITDVGAVTAVPVVPANVAPDPADIKVTDYSVPIDQWVEAPFQMNDKELREVSRGVLPRVAQQAIIALANTVDTFLITELVKGIPYSVGTPGTAPFQTDLTEFFDASVILDENKVPLGERGVILNPRAYNNAMQTRALQDAGWRGNSGVMNERRIVNALGANWEMTQSLTARTQGTGTGYQTAAAALAGARQFPVDTGTGTWLPGDVFTVAGDSEPYAVTAFAGGIMSFAPGLRVNIADNSAITRVPSNGVPNFLIHPEALAFVNRPLASDSVLRQSGAIFETVTDPESGLTIRVELLREHKRVRWSFDILFGGAVLNSDYGVRIYG